MLKRALLILLSAGLMMGLSGCTSNKATEEETPADVAEVAGEAEAGADEVAATDEPELGGDELSADEQLPDENAPATDVADAGDAAKEGGDDFATPAEELSGNPEKTDEMTDEFAANDPAADPATAEPVTEPTPEPMSEEPPPSSVDESLAAGGTPEPSMTPMEEEPKPQAKLRKIADTPYEQNGVLINAVYLARKGDDVEGVLNKIYGTQERKKELLKVNPTVKARGVKVGDKIYYNSPQRPTDNTKMMTYYEDMGLAPETYAVNKPENIREIAKNLLGDTNSWKELWATNLDLESKGELAEGTQLRYWAATAAPPVAMAQTDPALETPPPAIDPGAAAPVEAAPPPPPPMEQPPVDQTAMNTPPPDPNAPPPMDSAPPPPPPADLPPPPPPVDTAAQQPAPDHPAGEQPSVASDPAAAVMGALENPDQTMAMGVGAIVLLGAVAIFIMIRKRKARRQIDFHTSTQTQIE